MKKLFLFLLVALCLAMAGPLIPAPALAWTDGVETATITVATSPDNVTSTAVTIPRGAEGVSVYVPTITSSTISLKVSHDGGTTYDDLFCMNNNTNIVLASSAAGTGGMYLQFPPDCNIGFYNKLKVFCGSAQGDDRSFKVVFKKPGTKSNQ